MEDILDIQHESNQQDGPSLSQLDAEGYKFDFSRAFETGWAAFKDDIGQYILYTLVMLVIIIASLITIVGPILIAMPLSAGVMIYGSYALKKETREFNTFFEGFKFFGPLLGYLLIMVLLSLVFIVPFALIFGMGSAIADAANSEAIEAISAIMLGPLQILIMVISVLIQAFLFFSVPLIVIGGLGTMDAIKWSAKIARKQFWWILLFAFVVSLISQAGAFACYVGLLFTMPLSQCLILGAYADIVGLGNKQEASL
ncbi:hypothetical protein [Sanyastnella coralliicola]|uniref:hypothetical protein n=1 Tax=Sanyastnella coralliicola TaxID=3069118 RepID=UPI0027B89114|nr:hypothetical protein [Longitalea sp. SCSIO 12813]